MGGYQIHTHTHINRLLGPKTNTTGRWSDSNSRLTWWSTSGAKDNALFIALTLARCSWPLCWCKKFQPRFVRESLLTILHFDFLHFVFRSIACSFKFDVWLGPNQTRVHTHTQIPISARPPLFFISARFRMSLVDSQLDLSICSRQCNLSFRFSFTWSTKVRLDLVWPFIIDRQLLFRTCFYFVAFISLHFSIAFVCLTKVLKQPKSFICSPAYCWFFFNFFNLLLMNEFNLTGQTCTRHVLKPDNNSVVFVFLSKAFWRLPIFNNVLNLDNPNKKKLKIQEHKSCCSNFFVSKCSVFVCTFVYLFANIHNFDQPDWCLV